MDEGVVENVEVGALVHDRSDGDRSDARERALLRVRARAHGVREEPGNTADEWEHAECERERRQVLDERSGDAVGQELFVLRIPSVDTRDARQLARSAEADRTGEQHERDSGEEIVPSEQATDAAFSGAQLVGDHCKRKDEDQRKELASREICERDRGDREQVVAPRRRDGRALDGEQRQDEGRVRRDLRHHHGREEDPRHDDGEHRCDVRRPTPSGDPSRQEEGRDARGRHDPRVGEVDGLDVVGHEPVPEEGRDQQRIELRVALDVHAVDAGDE